MKQQARFFAVLLILTLFSACARAIPAGAPGEARRLPVLMYHSILKDPARAGKYVVSPGVFREDLCGLRAAGYETVTVAALTAFVRGEGTLPEKPVLITLDDGYYNNLTYVEPILRELGMTALISVVGAYSERYTEAPDPNPNYAYLSWEEIGALAAGGHIEIGNHTYDMHREDARKGAMRCFGESPEDYERAFSGDVGRMQTLLEKNAGVTPLAFAYPFGLISPESRAVLREMGFTVTLTCSEVVNTVRSGDPESLFSLGRFNRPAGVSTEAFLRRALGEG